MSVGAPQAPWPALAAARWQPIDRLAFHVDGQVVGSVALAHLPALLRWPQWITRDTQGLHLLAPPADRDDALASMNAQLRADGLIVAWRDETFGLIDPRSGEVLATFERAATRFWGTLTRGAHCNGYVSTSGDGRPTHLWIARRSPHKATDPGRLDNLVGGGVPHGQTPHETVLREGWEEAGLDLGTMQRATPGRVIRIDCDVPEGRMVEHIHVFDLRLPEGLTPRNQDGEVAEIQQLGIEEATAGQMTTDAALVTLDFLLRHRLLPAAQAEGLSEGMSALWVA
jgi:8-oxo-dGTP pyrophosphatase MutT (NUDIX family)